MVPMGMQYQPTVESAESIWRKQAEQQFYEVGMAIADTYHNKVVWLWEKGYQTEWEHKGVSEITQWLSYSQPITYLEITVNYWDPDDQNPFDGRNSPLPRNSSVCVSPGWTHTHNSGHVRSSRRHVDETV